MKFLFSLVILIACFAPNIGWSLVGDPVPPLSVKEWVQGSPVEINPGTNIFVVEILNVAVPNGHVIISDLANLQKRFKTNGVVVVGISDEPAEKIRANLLLDAASLTNAEISIGADNQRETSVSYLKPVEVPGRRVIPYAFIVGTNGILLWHGMPQRGLPEILSDIIAGKYDMELKKKYDLAGHQMMQFLAVARQGGDRADSAGRALLVARTNDVPLLCDMAYQIATAPRLATRDFGLANEALNQAEKLAQTNLTPVFLARAIVLYYSGKHEEGLDRAKQALASAQSPSEKATAQGCIDALMNRMGTMKAQPANDNKPGTVPAPAPAGSAGETPPKP